jgi:hypothetical protein
MAVSYEDGAKTILFGALNDAITGMVKVKYIRWIKPTTAGHGLVIQNTGSKVVCQMTCDTANEDGNTLRIDDWINGLKVTTLGSGTVEVRIE